MPIVIALHILLLSLTRYIAWPENFVWPYLHFQNLVLYKDIFFIYPPLYFLLLAGFDKIFGISLISLQVLSSLIIIATDVLLFLAAKKKIWPVIVYIPLQFFFEGNGMWPDQLLAPLFLLAFLALKSGRYALLGLTLGLALATKQTALYFIAPIVLAARHWSKVLIGMAIPVTSVILYLWQIGALGDFFQQGWVYIFSYHAGNKLQQLWPTITQGLILAILFLPPLLLGLAKKRFLLVILAITASLGMFTRFGYFHLQPALPFLALLMAESIWNLPVFLLALVLSLRLFVTGFHQEPKFLTKEITASAKIINQYLPPGSRTLILTPSDHYYWLTGTLPVGNFFTTSTAWNLAYPGVTERIVTTLDLERPRFIVVSNEKPKEILDFVVEHYHLVLKLPDGSGVFENNPVGLGEKL